MCYSSLHLKNGLLRPACIDITPADTNVDYKKQGTVLMEHENHPHVSHCNFFIKEFLRVFGKMALYNDDDYIKK